MTDLLDKIANLPPEKRALLELLLKEEGVDLTQQMIIPQSREKPVFPLSFAQQRLWFLDQLDPGSPLYNIPAAVRLRGKMDPDILADCFNEIRRRHESLRTIFREDDGAAVQVVQPYREMSIPFTDLGSLPAGERESAALLQARAEARQPFDLNKGPLLRVHVFRLGAEHHIVFLVMHHIIADGWSIGVLLRELAALYEARVLGRPSPLGDLPIQYADFACWQRQWLAGELLEGQIAYWQEQLGGELPVLQMPADHRRPTVQTSNGATITFSLPPDILSALKRFSQEEDATLFMSLLGCFLVALYRYTRQDDICIGTPIANRQRAEIEGLIGFFVNTLVLRIDLSAKPTFRELLRRVRQVTLDAYAHQDVPFEMLVDRLQPERDLSYAPFFQAMFAMQNTPVHFKPNEDLQITSIEIHSGTSKFDLTMTVGEDGGRLQGALEYNTDLFSPETMQRFLDHFSNLVQAVVADPDRPITRLRMLAPAERQRLLKTWNDTAGDYPRERCLHQLFSEQAAKHPDLAAVHYQGSEITYAELERRSNQLARYLQKQGVAPDVLVGIFMQRSLDLIVAILGILKAGGAYVPLDTNYPPQRLEYIVADTRLPVILTEQNLRHLVPGQAEPEAGYGLVCVDSDWEMIAKEAEDAVPSQSTPENLAYVLYTSGSTGKPKGVCVRHAGVVNLLTDFERREPLNLGDRCSWWTSLNFDVSVYEIFDPLLFGGTLTIVPDPVRVENARFIEWLHLNQINSAYLPPFILGEYRAWLEEQTRPEALHRLLVGVEPINELLLGAINISIPGLHILNGYGPTEATICCTLFSLDPENVQNRNTPIGKPTRNTQIYILDEQMQPVPVGVPGELYVGGDGLARGYLNRPDLTEERFVPNPFAPQLSQKLYKTGDLVRYLPDGNIEFIGRSDFQVKWHGFRIELGEIEAVLSQHPQVMKSVVIVWQEPADSAAVASEQSTLVKRLVAYVVVPEGGDLSAADLRAFASEHLPEYMLPSIFMIMDALPLTPNGKVDRGALPAPDIASLDLGTAYRPPRTPDEEILVQIWRELFKVEKIGIQDNFFDLGGHSLLATQLVSRVRQAFNIELVLRDFFNDPTIAGLARMVEKGRHNAQAVQLPPVSVRQGGGPIPLSYSQQRLWFLHQLDPQDASYNIPLALRMLGHLDLDALNESLARIVRRHAILRTVFPAVDGIPEQQILPEMDVPLATHDLTSIPTTQRHSLVSRLMVDFARQPFDLVAGPLLRVLLIKLDEDEHIILLTMHHIVSDGWSMGVFMREMAAFYQEITGGDTAALPDLALQYADFAAWQRQWLSDEALSSQLDYWKEQLSGQPPLLELPYDRPRPAMQSSRGAHLKFSIPPRLAKKLKQLARGENATLFMILLAAFQVFLYRISGQADISVGTPIANRNRGEIEDNIGFFVNTLVLRTQFSGIPAFRDVLQRVRAQALDAYAHQDLPFEMIVDALKLGRDLSHTPVFQVMFILQNAPTESIELPGLQMIPLDIETGLSPFDITLVLSETVDGLVGGFEYNCDLFDAATIERLSRQFRTALEDIASHPDQPITKLRLLSEEETRQLLLTWNDTQSTFPDDLCVHQLFEAQAARTPDGVAAIMPATAGQPRQQITYQELNQRSNQLAHQLRALGVKPENIVGLYLERSIEMLVGLLGILKAGGAYLPLDPAYPRSRLSLMLSDSGARIVVTSAALAGQIPGDGIDAIRLDCNQPLMADWDTGNPPPLASPDHIAYVIYTSGSTGTPKGVLVPHRCVVNHNLAMVGEFELTPADNVLQFATINFDTAVEEIFPTWAAGATLVLRPGEVLLTGDELIHLVESEKLTVLDLPTAYWHEWVTEIRLLKLSLPSSLRLVIVGGEKAAARSLAEWLELAPGMTWMNTYGPTEGTIVDTVFTLPPGTGEWDVQKDVPIGMPIANVKTYILDENLAPVPVGVPGELHIGGQAVVRGYLNRPDLTASRFIPDLFRDDPKGRLYKTGDLARYLPDGNIEFLGRVDRQVKLRGFRVEPGEIESQLNRHPGIAASVVDLRSDDGAGKRLVAYCVPGEPAPTVEELRQHLTQSLPDYMLPAAIVFLDHIPLNQSGKVDRHALPTPEMERSGSQPDYVAPHTTAEQLLLDIWERVLGFDSDPKKSQIGVNDNFFELGGDSILSIQIIAQAQQKGLRLTPSQFFEHPTIAGQALVASKMAAVQAEQGLVEGQVPLTPIQRWFFEQEFEQQHHWNQALLLKVTQPMDPARLERVVGHLVEHHDALRLRFEKVDASWRANIARVAEVSSFSHIDLREIPAADERKVIEERAAQFQASLDLARGPLFRVVYFDLGPQRYARLLIIVHHLAVDGVSWRILLEDFMTAYKQLEQGLDIHLPPKTTSFKYWAERLVEVAQQDEVVRELDYWQSIPALDAPQLPRDFSQGANLVSSLDHVVVELDTSETDALLRKVPPVYHTGIDDALITVLVETLAGWTRADGVYLEIEGHGREALFDDIDLSRTVGWFTSTYPLYLDVPGNTGYGEALKKTKERLRAVPNNGVGYGLLRYLSRDAQIAARMRSIREPEISFNYLGQFDQFLPAGESVEPAPEGRGSDRSPLGKRRLLIEVTAGITQDRLQLQWTYSRNLHKRATITKLANTYMDTLRQLIEHCLSPHAGGYTPSDFELANLDQRKLDKVLSTLGGRGQEEKHDAQ